MKGFLKSVNRQERQELVSSLAPLVSSAGEFHLHALAEPDMSLSVHPAPIIPVALRHKSGCPMGEQMGP
jgi:hypothetical protein